MIKYMKYKDFLKNLSFEDLSKIIKSIPDNAIDINFNDINDKLKNKSLEDHKKN